METIALLPLSFFFKSFSLIPHQNNKEPIKCSFFFSYSLHLSTANIFIVQKIYIDSGTNTRKQDYLTLQILKSHWRRFSCVYSRFGTCNKMYKPIQNNSTMINHQNIQSCTFSLQTYSKILKSRHYDLLLCSYYYKKREGHSLPSLYRPSLFINFDSYVT